tara:strand:+ start:675 stop:1910 length:1236 start_codon:yes stop_codon:yes gene_type:complete
MEYIHNCRTIDTILSNIDDNTQFVLLGESTHGTQEFYENRATITKKLIMEHGFNMVLFETDWLHMYDVNNYINNTDTNANLDELLEKNKVHNWLWNNSVITELIETMKSIDKPINLFGIDCYLLIESYNWLCKFLKKIDIDLYTTIKDKFKFLDNYNTTSDFMNDVMIGDLKHCETDIEQAFQNLIISIQTNCEKYRKNDEIAVMDIFTAEQCCEIIVNSYEYFKKQYLEPPGSNASWNTRDQHMLMTLLKLNETFKDSKFIIWAHNSHIGDATASNRSGINFSQNETWNLGQMCRAMFENTFIIGFGTYNGSVTAVESWNTDKRRFILNIPFESSIENILYNLCKKKQIEQCYINTKECSENDVFNQFRLQRFVGVIYNSANELQSHYIEYNITKQFDIYIFITHTHALL